MSWRIFVDPPASGAANMALDAALLELAQSDGLRALRLYGWNPGTLSFGRHEPALRRYDRDAIEQRGLDVVRRPTGGRAVWHHDEVTYAVAASADTFGSLAETYREIHGLLADALHQMGASVSLAGRKPAPGVGAGACFAGAVGGEVVTDDGRKIVGSAQVRSADAFLQHGSILLAAEQDVVAGVTRGDADPPAAAGLAELLGPQATFAAVSGAVTKAAAQRWCASAEAIPSPEDVRDRAIVLEPRYADSSWTWRR
ncbi:MAG TPA: hypothetical protein VGI92_06065 [Gemmatimonadales bacterium]|jgi:lipoate-protein ligase A